MLRAFQADVFRALAHPTRLAIVEVLREGEISVGAIRERLGIRQANLSQHLTVLRSRRMVRARKCGNQVLYSLPGSVLTELLDILQRYCHAHLSHSVRMLRKMDAGARAR